MKDLLKKLGLLNENQTMSITNVVVLIFVLITAFRSIFSGVVIDMKYFDWKIQELDVSSTLPLLFSLMNYGHRRMVQSQAEQTEKETLTS